MIPVAFIFLGCLKLDSGYDLEWDCPLEKWKCSVIVLYMYLWNQFGHSSVNELFYTEL